MATLASPSPHRIAALLAVMVALSTAALADIFDDADITIDTYEVTGSSLAEVQDAMTSDGPKGFWAYTTWNVSWTGDCETSVTGQITLPELAEDADLTDEEIAEFDRMRDALEAHELEHVGFGVAFAEEVAEAGCPANANEMLEPWLQQERDFDEETEHGRTQGVYLEEM